MATKAQPSETTPKEKQTEKDTPILIGRKVAVLELGKPSELLGNRKTFGHKNHDMTIVEGGIHVVSRKTKEEAVFFDADLVAAKLL